jgi:anthranilate synthase component 2
MILLIDNYDSFTYNLYQMVGSFRPDIQVRRNDELTVEEIEALNPSHIILSPGPGRPEDAGVCQEVVQKLAHKCPILGICLGHQAICQAYGATVGYAETLMHGKRGDVHIASGNPIFSGLAPLLEVGCYHSLAVKRETLPDDLLVIAETQAGGVMGVKHRRYPLYGLQFHPESILTAGGAKMMENFLKCKGGVSA